MSSSQKVTLPPSGFKMPVMRLNRVVLPAPFGPMTATISLVATSRLAPLTALKPEKVFWRPSTLSIMRHLS